MRKFAKIPDKFSAAGYILCAVLCLPLIYVLLGCPVFSVKDAFRRAEKANLVGPGKVLAELKMDNAPYEWLVLAASEDGVMLYAYDRMEPKDTQFIYLEKTERLVLAAAPGDELLWNRTEATVPLFLFDDAPYAARAELELTLNAKFQGESFEKTYLLESSREKEGFFRFDLKTKRGGGLGAEGYALQLLRQVTGYSMADTAGLAFPATVRLYDEMGGLIYEESFTVQSAAAKARMA